MTYEAALECLKVLEVSKKYQVCNGRIYNVFKGTTTEVKPDSQDFDNLLIYLELLFTKTTQKVFTDLMSIVKDSLIVDSNLSKVIGVKFKANRNVFIIRSNKHRITMIIDSDHNVYTMGSICGLYYIVIEWVESIYRYDSSLLPMAFMYRSLYDVCMSNGSITMPSNVGEHCTVSFIDGNIVLLIDDKVSATLESSGAYVGCNSNCLGLLFTIFLYYKN